MSTSSDTKQKTGTSYEKPPLTGSWNKLYVIVILALLLQIILFTLLSYRQV